MKYQAKRVQQSSGASRRKPISIVGALLLALSLAAGGTLAWLAVATPQVTNAFTPGTVDVTIDEDFKENDSEKKDVKVTNNNGSVTAYIRVAVIPTWEDEIGDIVAQSASLKDLNITWGDKVNWFEGTDGYYYYKSPVVPGESTNILIGSASVKTANGYRMNLQILAEAIQATPARAVEDAWPVTVTSDGTLSKYTNP